MSKTKCEFEWDSIMNDPERKAAADRRAAEEASLRMGKQEVFAGFYEKRAEHRKEYVQVQAMRYAIGAMAAGAAMAVIVTRKKK